MTATPDAGDGPGLRRPQARRQRAGAADPRRAGASRSGSARCRGDDQAFDFRRQTLDGKPVLTWWQGRVALYRGYGTGRIVDTRYRPVATVRMGNGYRMDAHEFQLTSRGTALAIAYEAVPWDLSKLGGRRDGIVEDNVVQEIDVDSGAVLFEWHALGTIPLAESIRTAPKQARPAARPVPPQRRDARPRRELHRLRPPHEHDLQARPRHRRDPLAARREALGLPARAGGGVPPPARRPPPRRRCDHAVRQRRRGPARARAPLARARAEAGRQGEDGDRRRRSSSIPARSSPAPRARCSRSTTAARSSAGAGCSRG